MSYGIFAAIGVVLVMLPSTARWCCALAVGAYVLGPSLGADALPTSAVLTVSGHVLAILVGVFGWLPWLQRRGMVGALRRTHR